MAVSQYQLIKQQVQLMPPQEQLRLIVDLSDSLAATDAKDAPQYLVLGEFHDTPGREFSTEDDFKLAEWYPTEEPIVWN